MPIGSGGEGLADAPLFLMNPDVLECYICCLPLTIPVYQCKNGHIACSPCWSKSDKLCPYCRIPKGYRRCPAMENLIESVISLCSYVKDGCTARVKHSEKRYHEKTCIFSPLCLCPHIKCYYGNKPEELYNHFSSDHFQCSNQFLFNTVFPLAILRRKATFSSEQVFFVESNEKILFVLHNFVRGDWVMATVVCVAPISSTRVFKFDLSATRFGDSGESRTSVELRSAVVTNIPRMHLVPPVGRFLWIPCNLCSEYIRYHLQLTIWNE